jgi:hypothetical protein
MARMIGDRELLLLGGVVALLLLAAWYVFLLVA